MVEMLKQLINAFGGRVTVIDDASNTTTVLHATHVCGTLIASATPASVKGMAYQPMRELSTGRMTNPKWFQKL